MNFKILILNEFYRQLKEMREFLLNIVFANLSLLVLFWGISESLAIQNDSVVFFMLISWYMGVHGISIPVYIVEDEVIDSTLSSIYQSTISFHTILIYRSLIQIAIDTIKFVPLFLVLYFIGPLRIDFNMIEWFISFVLVYFTVFILYQIGFIFAALAIRFKRFGQVVGVFDYILLFFAGITLIPVNPIVYWASKVLLPFLNLREILSSIGNSFTIVPLLILLVQSLVYWLASKTIIDQTLMNLAKNEGI